MTNAKLQKTCLANGVEAQVLHDPLPVDSGDDQSVTMQRKTNQVLVPLSYANDEPLQKILEAASLSPELQWYLTGKAPQTVKGHAPRNVIFTGYLDAAEYDELVRTSTVLIALTNRPHTMQRAAYEALAAATPLVTSNYEELRSYFGTSAYYTSNESSSIVNAIAQALADPASCAERLSVKFDEKVADEAQAILLLKESLAHRIADRNV
ncbi:glycosyltransferase [Rhodococcus sp. BP22]|uniref:glycosyltransferase n=1 Tax=Rhodococcus sp. BP22 TaxID=2758566 RepID=UPI001645CA1F|nr:glycosyltransferase [Rhodococcus sp. BP22]